VVASAIAYWLNQGAARSWVFRGLRRRWHSRHEPTQTTYDPASMDAEEAERTRRLMRNCVASVLSVLQIPIHGRSVIAAPVVLPPPVALDFTAGISGPLAEMMKDLARRYTPQPEPVVPSIDQEMLARQRELEEKMRQLDAERELAQRKAMDLRKAAAVQLSASQQDSAAISLVTSLRDPASLRKAILLNEILGKPVALSKPELKSLTRRARRSRSPKPQSC